MHIRDIFIISKGTKVVLAITFSVSVLAVMVAWFYYSNLNRMEDPRIMGARKLLAQFEEGAGRIDRLDGFPLLDSANAIFRSYPDYESSFETGLIYNNKCSALLMMALYDSTITDTEKNTLLDLSMKYCDSSIAVYTNWIGEWGDLPAGTVAERIRPFMDESDPLFSGLNFRKVFAKRVRNITEAQVETPRRLSVSMTNKGTIYRHLLMVDSAYVYYKRALALWDDNRTAKSNLSVLMGGDPVKPTIIESLFPPDKDKR
jgi:hypothetical protein